MRYDAPRHPPTSHPTLSTPSLSRPTAPDWGPPARTATVLVETGMLPMPQGGRHVRRLGPGDYFGEVALTMDIPRTASVSALTPSTVASCDRATFDEFIRPLFADDSPS